MVERPKADCFAASAAPCLVALAALLSPAPARAAEASSPPSAHPARLFHEPAEVTSVADAFDDDHPFELHLAVGIEHRFKHAHIRRETALVQPGLSSGGFVAKNENVATFDQSTTRLHLGADLGLYRDLALLLRLPITLQDKATLADLNGSTANPERLRDSTGHALFSVPFTGPVRSGVDYVGVGIDAGILNQTRDPSKPTWLFGVEVRLPIGTPLHACADNSRGGTPVCDEPGHPGTNREPGISRGTTGLGLHTVLSKRIGYAEPYAGFWFLAEVPHDGSDFGKSSNLEGVLVNHPPLEGTFAVGAQVTPWEERENFRRVALDLRLAGTYHSPGRDYSELFDPLGSSTAPTLRNPKPASYRADPVDPSRSVGDPSRQVYFTGLTDTQAYGSVAVRGSFVWQPAEVFKLALGGSFTFNQSHLVTAADACNPTTKDAATSGPCHTVAARSGTTLPTGIPNPNQRDPIDFPGHRFSVDDGTIASLFLDGIVMF